MVMDWTKRRDAGEGSNNFTANSRAQ